MINESYKPEDVVTWKRSIEKAKTFTFEVVVP